MKVKRGFSLIEVIIVLAIIAVLAIAVIALLNPAELIRQAHDGARLSDLSTINRALNAAERDYTPLGTSNVIYISVPDTTLSGNQTSTCGTLGLPVTTGGFTYQCSSPQNYRKTDGTGWIPVNFSGLSTGAPFSALPVDPTNSVSAGLYYAYTVNGVQWQLNAYPESQKQKTVNASGTLALGTNMSLYAFPGSGVGTAAWPNGYSYRRTITIDHTKVPNTDQTNFPVLISGTYSYLATNVNGGKAANSNGYDIIFTSDASGTVKLDFERETYSAATGLFNYWVQVPTVSHTVDTNIYLFYGNSGVTTDQSNAAGTWDSNYLGVWHLPDGTTLSLNDSTGINTGTNHGVAAYAGFVDGGASTTATKWIDTGLASSSAPVHTGTISAWFYANGSSTDAYNLVLGNDNRGTGGGYSIFYGATIATVYYQMDTSSTNFINLSTGAMLTNQWNYAALSWDGTTVKYYLNGLLKGSAAQTKDPMPFQNFGLFGTAGVATFYYDHGIIDEARVSNVARSTDWYKTEYASQNSPSTFYSVGSETTP